MFKKKKNVLSPLTGKSIKIEECEDQVFSQKILGDGVAIIPSNGEVSSPFDGEVIQLVDTKHAIGLKSDSGIEILIHLGMDTVSLNGEGFQYFVKEGEKISQGQKLMSMDIDFVLAKGLKIVTPIVITNHRDFKNIEFGYGDVKSGNDIIITYK